VASGIQGLLGGLAAAVLGVAALSGRLEPSHDGRQAAPGNRPSADVRTTPERPRALVDVAAAEPSGRTIRVPGGGNLQAALDDARPGDHIALDPGATYRGPFRLPRKEGAGWILIAPSSMHGLPPAGQRIDRSHTSALPKLVSSSGVVLETSPGAHHYRFVGIEVAPADGVYLRALVLLGEEEKDLEAVPHHLVFDRCYFHGDARRGTRRGIALNSRETAIDNSYFSDFKEVGADSQAIAGWNGPGPYRIANNYLEAAGENVMFGGADPSIAGLVPADIEIVRNHFAKPLRWKADDPSYEGVAWAVKNLFELKNARRVLVDGNLFEYNWPHAQNGFALLFTVRNQDGGAPWSVVEDVTFVNNVVRHVAAGINILGTDDIHRSERTQRIAIRNNLFMDVGGTWGKGRLFQLLDGTHGVSIEHNTAIHSESILFGGDRAPHGGFVFQNNIVFNNRYGIMASGTGTGRPTLDRYFPGAIVRRNVIVGGNPGEYPPDNFFPASLDQVGFVGPQASNFRLAPTSSYKRASTDRRDLGADFDAMHAITSIHPSAFAKVTADRRSAKRGGWSTRSGWASE
jgi:hypothetical protein